MVTDPIADFINKLKNASAVNKPEVEVPYSTFKHEVAKTLERLGYLSNVEKVGKDQTKTLQVEIIKPIESTIRLSKPSRRLYSKHTQAPRGKGGRGFTVISTPQGVMSTIEAQEKQVGGELLFTII